MELFVRGKGTNITIH
ncbi:hypothetical protein CAEBREN_20288 [Caenorhabditis brenneri]|uniref:Uncharacterized protein n=1 Tax=Caenorhabditis brenneri TaxID=135651 RepID=G0P5Q0_CAEBE|nr:hypothetical protein CAEBREN_20288 [Caenorhabditis brenneri]